MTREEQERCIAECCDAFKQKLLSKVSKDADDLAILSGGG
jgi:hypothetical protein